MNKIFIKLRNKERTKMKYLLTLMLIFTISITAQNINQNVMSEKNSTTTTLDSAGVFTGTTELLRGYNFLSVTIRSDSSGTYKIMFGKTSTITTANAVKTYSFSYTANDTLHTKTVGVDAPYFKVVYTSSADTQHTFNLVTMLNAADVLPRTVTGKLDVNGTVIVTGGATEASLALLTPSTNSYSVWFSTAGTVKDSVSWGFTSKSVTFINDNTSTDTLFVSTSASFPSTNTVKRLGGEGFTKRWSTTKLYFKVGAIPAASKKLRVEAN
jgi:hypothetical protein